MSKEYTESLRQRRLSDEELVEKYTHREIDGRRVMGRLLEKIDLAHRGAETLRRRDGSAFVGDDGKELSVLDYLSVAQAQGHGADVIILNFIRKSEYDADFDLAHGGMKALVSAYLPPEAPSEPR